MAVMGYEVKNLNEYLVYSNERAIFVEDSFLR